MKKLPTHKSKKPDCFIGEFYQTLKNNYTQQYCNNFVW